MTIIPAVWPLVGHISNPESGQSVLVSVPIIGQPAKELLIVALTNQRMKVVHMGRPHREGDRIDLMVRADITDEPMGESLVEPQDMATADRIVALFDQFQRRYARGQGFALLVAIRALCKELTGIDGQQAILDPLKAIDAASAKLYGLEATPTLVVVVIVRGLLPPRLS